MDGTRLDGTWIYSLAWLAPALVALAACEVGPNGQEQVGPPISEAGMCQVCQVLGADAVCIDEGLIAAVADAETLELLKQVGPECDNPNELCAPCVDPRTNQPTGACALCSGGGGLAAGTCENPQQVIDPNTFPACQPGGRCVPREVVEAAAAGISGQLPACQETPNGVCVPEDAVRFGANYSPARCSRSGLDGRCLPQFVVPPEQAGLLATIPDDPSCAASQQTCIPCFDPTNGNTPTGACGLTPCDTVANPTAATCVQGRGQCLPAQLVAAQLQAQGGDTSALQNLAQLDCAPENLCVPNRLARQPTLYQMCSGPLGILVDQGTCLDVGVLQNVPLSGLFPNAGCPEVESCVPCETTLPLIGTMPTNAPGCAELYGL